MRASMRLGDRGGPQIRRRGVTPARLRLVEEPAVQRSYNRHARFRPASRHRQGARRCGRGLKGRGLKILGAAGIPDAVAVEDVFAQAVPGRGAVFIGGEEPLMDRQRLVLSIADILHQQGVAGAALARPDVRDMVLAGHDECII